jgi:hypothetical protein
MSAPIRSGIPIASDDDDADESGLTPLAIAAAALAAVLAIIALLSWDDFSFGVAEDGSDSWKLPRADRVTKVSLKPIPEFSTK